MNSLLSERRPLPLAMDPCNAQTDSGSLHARQTWLTRLKAKRKGSKGSCDETERKTDRYCRRRLGVRVLASEIRSKAHAVIFSINAHKIPL